MNPFSANLPDVEYIDGGEEALIDVHSNDAGLKIFRSEGVNRFWLTDGKNASEIIHDRALSDILPHCTTYLAEKTSNVCLIKTKSRNRLEIFAELRLAVTSIKPSITCFWKNTNYNTHIDSQCS